MESGDRYSLDYFALGSTSSRLLTGDSEVARKLEKRLREVYGRSGCLLFNSGYHANIGILPALLGRKDLILSDKLNHASIMDGMRLCQATYKRYRHRDYDHLVSLLKKLRKRFEKVIIVSESVFSMDGDVVDIGKLVAVKEEFDCTLYLDEAHAIGLYGEKGLGMAEEQGCLRGVDYLVGTFGKAPASMGAFVICAEEISRYLVNHSRSFIFTTGLPPIIHNWNLFVLEEILLCEKKRRHLQSLSGKLRSELVKNGLVTDGSTNIVPVMIGEDKLAVTLAEMMRDKKYLVFPVRPPAVPEGTARFRLSLTAGMNWDDIKAFPEQLAEAMNRSRS
ncbi:putative 8-amino-7-oxononanoate synthase [Desulfomarina profundi]|uniref:8-amino-7-oxononanoate synthase n=1 Tax=Desulfomarina profundi TaxID=2772557 RepID=A0A8D5JH26_9BACT|nr:8-amino-7-oxononanoate synthase [Desulfomarina profundi]BCL60949.1 putative 8-amino-7-oxononanoate synthase [Desulfomarina profundi]